MDGYRTVTVIVNGALDSEWDAGADEDIDDILDSLRDSTAGVAGVIEVYVLDHPHSDDIEDCQCVQYSTDHRPVGRWSRGYSPTDSGRVQYDEGL